MEDDSGDDANAMSFSLQPHNPPMPDFAAPLPQPDQGSGFGIDQDGKATFVAKSLLAGGIAGMVAKSSVAPLDRIKILLQAQNPTYRHLGVFSGIAAISRREGFRALFLGNGAQMVRIFPYSAVQFTAFEFYKNRLPAVIPLAKESHLVRFMSGSMAGVTAVILTFPLDLVRARLAFQTSTIHIYRGITHALLKIRREEGGIKGLYRGIMPSLLGMIPYAGFAFYSYEMLKRFCMTHCVRWTCKRESRPDGTTMLVLRVPAKLFCGGISGAVAQTFAYPLDVARRRMQLGDMSEHTKRFHGLGTIGTLAKIYREDGIIRGLYRGLSVNYLRAVPMVALSFTVNELMKQALKLETGVSAGD